MRSFLQSIRLPWVIFTLLVFAILVKLAIWQNNRAIEKQQRIERIAQYAKNSRLTLADVVNIYQLNKKDEAINDLLIDDVLQFQAAPILLLDNQINHGRFGYKVLQVADSSQGKLLVNLGWHQAPINRNKLPKLTPVVGQHQVLAHVRVPELGFSLSTENTEIKQNHIRIEQIDVEKISKLIGVKLLPFALYLDKKETLGYEKNWQPIVMPPEKHRAYAFQWASLALAWLILMCWAAIKNNNKGQKS